MAITGGTHGNEYTGVWCVKQYRSDPKQIARPHLETSALLCNPRAVQLNRRFVDTDLNRAFSGAALTDKDLPGYEHNRAKVLDSILGPKGSESPAADFIIDLHTSTANMGVTFCLTPADSLAFRCAAYVQQQMPGERVFLLIEGATEGATAVANMTGAGAVSTVGKHGFEIEVGPTPQGLLHDPSIQLMRTAIQHSLDYLEGASNGAAPVVPRHVLAYCDCGKIPWEVDGDDFPTACTHAALQDRDFQPIKRGEPVLRHRDGSEMRYEGEDGLVGVFINEAAYYSKASGLGIGLARPMSVDTETMERTRPTSKL